MSLLKFLNILKIWLRLMWFFGWNRCCILQLVLAIIKIFNMVFVWWMGTRYSDCVLLREWIVVLKVLITCHVVATDWHNLIWVLLVEISACILMHLFVSIYFILDWSDLLLLHRGFHHFTVYLHFAVILVLFLTFLKD